MEIVKPKMRICIVCDPANQPQKIFEDLELAKDFVLVNDFFEAVLLVNQGPDTKKAPVQISYQKIAQMKDQLIGKMITSQILSQVQEKKDQIGEAIKKVKLQPAKRVTSDQQLDFGPCPDDQIELYQFRKVLEALDQPISLLVD